MNHSSYPPRRPPAACGHQSHPHDSPLRRLTFPSNLLGWGSPRVGCGWWVGFKPASPVLYWGKLKPTGSWSQLGCGLTSPGPSAGLFPGGEQSELGVHREPGPGLGGRGVGEETLYALNPFTTRALGQTDRPRCERGRHTCANTCVQANPSATHV